MAVPWQTDTASCRDGYSPEFDPYLPTFWPARVPNNILNKAMYERTIDTDLTLQERQQSFAWRQGWLDDLPIEGAVTYTAQINSMVENFDKLAVVQSQPGVCDDPNFPTEMQVGLTSPKVPTGDIVGELRKLSKGSNGAMHGQRRHRKVDLSTIEKINLFGRKP